MSFDNPFEMILYGIESVFQWLEGISVFGISIFSMSAFVLLLSLFWRFILSPFFGRDGGSMSAGVSDVVSSTRSYTDRRASKVSSADREYRRANNSRGIKGTKKYLYSTRKK